MSHFSYMRLWKLCNSWRIRHRLKCTLITLFPLLSILLILFHFSNAGDIISYYLSQDPKPLPVSIQCNGGRLGNQMCTYATLYGLSALNKGRPFVAQNCNLEYLRPMFKQLSIQQAPPLYIQWNSWSVLSYLKPSDLTIPPNSNYIGGFVYPCSYTFFDHVQNELRGEFQFTLEIQLHVRKVLQKANVHSLKHPTYVGIHVRRGDYQKRWLDIYKGIEVNMEFFQKAVEYFRKKYKNVVFVVVSDDRIWCVENLVEPLGVYVSEEGPSPAHDMAILAHCNHTIMTYGTFGFWGAYLAGGETVYFDKFLLPNTSFAKTDFIFDKMYPPRWKGIVTANVSSLKL
ncbi:galactoside alpha-(1,2)-fucosyltransferase 2-like [Argiope bruennichi]|uniref:galactoside alpha-(1,2)-fucosyltransferase 2-like n=1 Tax=Argiope bruennichi TaxID=94029 RepID=UPI0024947F2F|nr:galactoside alpha-(1,2)-fucosyltransferase 2-like [Argiope bruennichi]